MKTIIVNLRTCKGKDVTKIDRTTQYGNPFRIGRDGNRFQVVFKHKLWLIQWLKRGEEIVIDGFSNKWVCEHIYELKPGKWGCWCVPLPCHGNNLLWLRNYIHHHTGQ